MRKFLVLLKVSFRAMLAAFSFGSSKKRAAGGIGALLLLGFLALYISGAYSFLIADMLQSIGLFQFLMPMMAMYACLMALMLTAFAASGILFGGKDNDLILSLPVSAFAVMLSRVLALYLENLLFIGLWMLPTSIAYCVYGGSFNLWFVLCMLVVVLLLPLLASLIGVLGGFVIAFTAAKFRRKALLSSLLYFALFGGILAVALQFNKLPAFLMENQKGVLQALHTWLLPFGLLIDMLAGSAGALLGFMGICLLPFLAVVYLFSTQYKKILTGLSSHHTRSDYRLHKDAVRAQGQFLSLFKKEAGRYFGTPIYFFNTGFGLIMLLGGAVYLCVAKGTVTPVLLMLGGLEGTLPLLVLAVCFLLSTVCTTCVSISLEGKTLWILKEAPISARTLFAAKVGLNVILVSPLMALCLVTLGVVYGVAAADIATLTLFAFALNCYVALSGLLVNLLLPKMDAANDTLVVKQSASAVFGLFGGWVVIGLGVLLYLLVGEILGLRLFLLAASVLLLLINALLWRYLVTWGAKKLLAL